MVGGGGDPAIVELKCPEECPVVIRMALITMSPAITSMVMTAPMITGPRPIAGDSCSALACGGVFYS